MRGAPLVIIGCGGHGREVLDIVEAANAAALTYDVLGFLDDDPGQAELAERRGVQVLGPVPELSRIDAAYVIGVGSGETRRCIAERADGQPVDRLVHPAATLGSDLRIGPGAVIAAGARLTTNITLGRHVHLSVNATLSHDCTLDDYVTLNPGSNVSGNVSLGAGATLGVGSSVMQGVSVGAATTVGAGAVVVDDLPAGVTAVGIPARPVSR